MSRCVKPRGVDKIGQIHHFDTPRLAAEQFIILSDTKISCQKKKAADSRTNDLLPIWLPDQDSNLETPDPESGVLPVTPSGKVVFKF